jgi:hypothetical protein
MRRILRKLASHLLSCQTCLTRRVPISTDVRQPSQSPAQSPAGFYSNSEAVSGVGTAGSHRASAAAPSEVSL